MAIYCVKVGDGSYGSVSIVDCVACSSNRVQSQIYRFIIGLIDTML